MDRLEPHAEQRLRLAALELYAVQGYDNTTIGDIAARAGVTSRTYFRYFPDKREVLFGGADVLRDRIASSLREAPAGVPPVAATLHAMSTCAEFFLLREHEQMRRRDQVIGSSNELQEREGRKLASIAGAMADGLVDRGCDHDSAHLTADLAVVVFKQAARLWMADPLTPYAVLLYRAAEQAQRVFVAEEPSPVTQS